MSLSARSSSTTSGGSANATSLGGYTSGSTVSQSTGGFFENISTAQNDAGHTDYRCVFIYCPSGSNPMDNVKVTAVNVSGGSTVQIVASSVATAAVGSYQTQVLASETTAPTQITGSWASSVNLGNMTAGQVKAVWLKRTTAAKTKAKSGDKVTLVISADEVITGGSV